jgi:hypothetical protein
MARALLAVCVLLCIASVAIAAKDAKESKSTPMRFSRESLDLPSFMPSRH